MFSFSWWDSVGTDSVFWVKPLVMGGPLAQPGPIEMMPLSKRVDKALGISLYMYAWIN